MKPDDNVQPAPQQSQPRTEAASNIVRGQVDKIYEETYGSSQPAQAAQQPAAQAEHRAPSPDDWQKYHSAWQDYYQKYYERYYVGHIHQARQAIAEQHQMPQPKQAETLSQDDALDDLRSNLRGKITDRAQQVRKSRHFVPIAAGLGVMLIFAFLQYNQLLFANVQAYISPGNIDPQNIIVDPTTSTAVDPSLTNIVIPKINVDAPVDYSATTDHDSQMKSMINGLAYFGIPGANSRPGQIGNTPVAGHSSNDVFETGNYKFIFAQLEKVQEGDIIYANYEGTRYTYSIVKKEVVLPNEVSRLVFPTDKPLLTLITCTPLGTAQKRLLVTAEQINPSPSGATSAPEQSSTQQSEVSMPGSDSTLIERLFGQ